MKYPVCDSHNHLNFDCQTRGGWDWFSLVFFTRLKESSNFDSHASISQAHDEFFLSFKYRENLERPFIIIIIIIILVLPCYLEEIFTHSGDFPLWISFLFEN
jgi:hypothetical protein